MLQPQALVENQGWSFSTKRRSKAALCASTITLGATNEPHGVQVEPVAGDLGVVDAGQGGDLGRDGSAGLVVSLEGVVHAQDLALRRVGEAHHGQLNHLVVAGVAARGLHVEHQAKLRAGRRGGQGRPRRQLAQHLVLARSLQRRGHGLQLLAGRRRGHTVAPGLVASRR